MASSTRKSSRAFQAATLDGANVFGAADSIPLQPMSMGLAASQQMMSFFVRAQQAQFATMKHLTDSLTRALEEMREAREPGKLVAIQTRLAVDQMTFLMNESIKLFAQTSSVLADAAAPALPAASEDLGTEQLAPATLDGTPLAMMQKLPEVWLDWARQWDASISSPTRAP